MKNINDVDKNLRVFATDDSKVVWFDVEEKPFQIYGLLREDGMYVRMPLAVAKEVNDGVDYLNHHTAGGRVRFATDSDEIFIKADMHYIDKMPHFPLTGSGGFDLFKTVNGKECYVNTFVPPFDYTDGYESSHGTGVKEVTDFTVNFPLYAGVKKLQIGIKSGSVLMTATSYRNEKPIVYYGSSITQGGCASRPGNSYQCMVSRNLNVDFVNLGFSGSARAEETVAEYIANLPMSVFVYDYDHNAPTAEYLEETHGRMFRTVRAKNPDLPILFMTRPQPSPNEDDIKRREIIRATFEGAKKDGDKNVYFIDGGEITREFCGDAATVDGTHPNDLGFMAMANAVTKILKEIDF